MFLRNGLYAHTQRNAYPSSVFLSPIASSTIKDREQKVMALTAPLSLSFQLPPAPSHVPLQQTIAQPSCICLLSSRFNSIRVSATRRANADVEPPHLAVKAPSLTPFITSSSMPGKRLRLSPVDCSREAKSGSPLFFMMCSSSSTLRKKVSRWLVVGGKGSRNSTVCGPSGSNGLVSLLVVASAVIVSGRKGRRTNVEVQEH